MLKIAYSITSFVDSHKHLIVNHEQDGIEAKEAVIAQLAAALKDIWSCDTSL
jgi:hypothetical protein